MISDEERREAALRLRKARVERYNSILNGIHLGESAGVCAQIVSPHEDQVRAAADRLADLIEPAPSCEFWDPEERECYNVRTVRPVDRDALLALADEIDRDGKMQRARQKDGEHWFIDGLDVIDYARRIREALGVES